MCPNEVEGERQDVTKIEKKGRKKTVMRSSLTTRPKFYYLIRREIVGKGANSFFNNSIPNFNYKNKKTDDFSKVWTTRKPRDCAFANFENIAAAVRSFHTKKNIAIYFKLENKKQRKE